MSTTKKNTENTVNEAAETVKTVKNEAANAENTQVIETEKKENFIKRGFKAYGKAFKEHPVKTVLKTVAIPAAFVGGVVTGKAIFGDKASEVIDVVADVIPDVAEDVANEITE